MWNGPPDLKSEPDECGAAMQLDVCPPPARRRPPGGPYDELREKDFAELTLAAPSLLLPEDYDKYLATLFRKRHAQQRRHRLKPCSPYDESGVAVFVPCTLRSPEDMSEREGCKKRSLGHLLQEVDEVYGKKAPMGLASEALRDAVAPMDATMPLSQVASS